MSLLKLVFYILIGYFAGRILRRVIIGIRAALTGRRKARPTNVRNVSKLASDGDGDAALTQEVIQTRGPLKPGHLRQSTRDTRLFPKEKPDRYQWPPPPKTVYFTEAEADRLFSMSLRTKNRDIHNLATDTKQLKRYGLPSWTSEQEIADALGVSVKTLQHYACHRIRETCPHYVRFAIPKRNGSQRLIYAPKRRLKALQRKTHELLVSKLPVSEYAHGFVKGRSVASNAKLHVGKKIVVKFDIRDCFPTLHYGRVRGLLIAMGYSYPVATSLALLMTEAPRQPVEIDGKIYHVPVGDRVCIQGAPTSPGLCNAIMKRLDQRLAKFALSAGYDYSRYADDLTFSGDDVKRVPQLKKIVQEIVEAEGFVLNPAKTRLMRRGGCQCVTGVVVNDVAGLSRKDRRQMRAAFHQFAHKSETEQRKLLGKLDYLRMLNPDQANALQKLLPATSSL